MDGTSIASTKKQDKKKAGHKLGAVVVTMKQEVAPFVNKGGAHSGDQGGIRGANDAIGVVAVVGCFRLAASLCCHSI